MDVHTCILYCVCMVLVYSVMTCCLLAPTAPSSVTISGSSTVGYTQTLHLTCRVSGIANSYQWYHNGTRLYSTSRYYSKSAQPSDSGRYQCKVCNWAYCKSSSSYTVTVIGWLTWIVHHVVNSRVELLPVHKCVLCVVACY